MRFIGLDIYLDDYEVNEMRKSWYFAQIILILLLISSARASERALNLSYDFYVGGIKVVAIGLVHGVHCVHGACVCSRGVVLGFRGCSRRRQG